MKKTFLQPTLCTIDSSPPGGADAGFIDACSAVSARWYANTFVILVWNVTLNIRPSYWSIGVICKESQNLCPLHTVQEPEFKNRVFTITTHQILSLKGSVFRMFLPTLKRKTGVFKFLRFEERFWEAPFTWSWPINVDGRPNVEINSVFKIFWRSGGRGITVASYSTVFNVICQKIIRIQGINSS